MVTVVGRDESKIKRATCSSCASILEYYPSEIVTLWSGYDYSGGSDGAAGFKCPCCGADIILERW